MLKRLRDYVGERVGQGTHTVFRSDTLLGNVANLLLLVVSPLLCVVLFVAHMWTSFRSRHVWSESQLGPMTYAHSLMHELELAESLSEPMRADKVARIRKLQRRETALRCARAFAEAEVSVIASRLERIRTTRFGIDWESEREFDDWMARDRAAMAERLAKRGVRLDDFVGELTRVSDLRPEPERTEPERTEPERIHFWYKNGQGRV